MRGLLQYSPEAFENWKNAGIVRSIEKDYQVQPIVDDDRLGEPQVIGYGVSVRAKMLEISGEIFTREVWDWRVFFSAENTVLGLGVREFSLEYSAEPDRNNLEFHTVRIEFTITNGQFSIYTTPLAVSP